MSNPFTLPLLQKIWDKLKQVTTSECGHHLAETFEPNVPEGHVVFEKGTDITDVQDWICSMNPKFCPEIAEGTSPELSADPWEIIDWNAGEATVRFLGLTFKTEGPKFFVTSWRIETDLPVYTSEFWSLSGGNTLCIADASHRAVKIGEEAVRKHRNELTQALLQRYFDTQPQLLTQRSDNPYGKERQTLAVNALGGLAYFRIEPGLEEKVYYRAWTSGGKFPLMSWTLDLSKPVPRDTIAEHLNQLDRHVRWELPCINRLGDELAQHFNRIVQAKKEACPVYQWLHGEPEALGMCV